MDRPAVPGGPGADHPDGPAGGHRVGDRTAGAELFLPRILVLVIMPSSPADWFCMTHETATLRHCAYWASLAGMPPRGHTSTVTVEVPKRNQLSVQALEEMMQRIANRGDP